MVDNINLNTMSAIDHIDLNTMSATRYVEWANFAESMMIMALFERRGDISENAWELIREEVWI